MNFTLDPPDGVGDLVIGSTREAIGQVLQQYGDPTPFQRGEGHLGWCVERPATIFTYCDADGRVDAIELGTPGRRGKDRVFFRDIDVFRTPVADVLAGLERLGVVVTASERSYSFTAPDLLLGFWRDGGPSDGKGMPKYFESVLVARPGYYDRTPTG